MTIILDYPLPKTGIFNLNVSQQLDIRCSAQQAQRKVGYWVTEHVHYALVAKEPSLVVQGDGAIWEVPILFASVMAGEVGRVGYARVDVKTGEILEISESAEIMKRVQQLGKIVPSFVPHRVDPDFIHPDIPRAPLIDVRNK